MERVDTHLAGCALLKPLVREDARGYFLESFRTDLFEQLMGHSFTVVQQNESSSRYGVVRGLHWQIPPHAQAKLIRVLSGEIRDVVCSAQTTNTNCLSPADLPTGFLC